jgi:hypothetical protein
MRENAASLLTRYVTLPYACVIQVFIAVVWQQRGEAMRHDERLVRGSAWFGSARFGSVRFGSARHGTEKTPLRLLLRNRGSVFRCYNSYMA